MTLICNPGIRYSVILTFAIPVYIHTRVWVGILIGSFGILISQ